MPIRAIAYSSSAIEDLATDRLANLISDAAAFNLQGGVTGVLLYDGGEFPPIPGSPRGRCSGCL